MNVYKLKVTKNFSTISLKRYSDHVDDCIIIAPDILGATNKATFILNELCLQAGKHARFEILGVIVRDYVPLVEDML